MKASEAKEGLQVFDSQGTGTLHRNTGHENVSEWYVKWDEDGSECAVLSFDYLSIILQDNGAMSYTEAHIICDLGFYDKTKLLPESRR